MSCKPCQSDFFIKFFLIHGVESFVDMSKQHIYFFGFKFAIFLKIKKTYLWHSNSQMRILKQAY